MPSKAIVDAARAMACIFSGLLLSLADVLSALALSSRFSRFSASRFSRFSRLDTGSSRFASTPSASAFTSLFSLRAARLAARFLRASSLENSS